MITIQYGANYIEQLVGANKLEYWRWQCSECHHVGWWHMDKNNVVHLGKRHEKRKHPTLPYRALQYER